MLRLTLVHDGSSNVIFVTRLTLRFQVFILGSLAVGVIVPYDSDGLLRAIANGAGGAAKSPYVIGMQLLDIKVLPHIVNVGVLTSVFSAGNAFVYAASPWSGNGWSSAQDLHLEEPKRDTGVLCDPRLTLGLPRVHATQPKCKHCTQLVNPSLWIFDTFMLMLKKIGHL
jgi:hypothetical protein